MHENEFEIIVLKPTRLFCLFLSLLRPDIKWPSLSVFQKDSTAYTFVKSTSDSALIQQIEDYFPEMLRHEVVKWLGEEVCDLIKGSFVDFLSFFKFEVHTDVILMEQNFKAGRQMICIKPRSVLFTRREEAIETNADLKRAMQRINTSHPASHSTVIIKNFQTKKDIHSVVKQFYRPILHAEMRRMGFNEAHWTDIQSVEGFNRYFMYDVHTQLIHLS